MDTALAKVALNRFGLGARPGEADRIAADPMKWLWPQAVLPGGAPRIAGVQPSDVRLVLYEETVRERGAARKDLEARVAAAPAGSPAPVLPPPPPDQFKPFEAFIADLKARVVQASVSDTPFTERMALFWSNHLAVSVAKGGAQAALVVPYENEAIRPFVTGRFTDMLKASAFHPAMLLYLDAATSVGPESRAGQHGKRSYNENYAREVMELHTLGVNGGYSQDDIIQLANILTGITINRATGKAEWNPNWHQPGDLRVLGATFPGGTDQIDAVLEMLAVHPKTAAHLCRKIAVHFLGDKPPAALVSSMSKTWVASKGSLPDVYKVLLGSAEAWNPVPVKFKTPEQFVVSAARGLGLGERSGELLRHIRALAQVPFSAQAPTGYGDADSDWLSPGSLVERINVASALAGLYRPSGEPVDLLTGLVNLTPSSHTGDAVRRAPSGAEAVALILASPEFQRR